MVGNSLNLVDYIKGYLTGTLKMRLLLFWAKAKTKRSRGSTRQFLAFCWD
jgi:hypothetical protein